MRDQRDQRDQRVDVDVAGGGCPCVHGRVTAEGPERAVFLDRDGVLIPDTGYPDDPAATQDGMGDGSIEAIFNPVAVVETAIEKGAGSILMGCVANTVFQPFRASPKTLEGP